MGLHRYPQAPYTVVDADAILKAADDAVRFANLPALPTKNVSLPVLMRHFDTSLAQAFPEMEKAERADLVRRCIGRYDQARGLAYKTAFSTLHSASSVSQAQAIARAEVGKAYAAGAAQAVDDDEEGTEAERIAAAPFRVNFWGRVRPRNRA